MVKLADGEMLPNGTDIRVNIRPDTKGLHAINVIEKREGRGCFIVFTICLAFVVTRFFYPGYFDNEWVYSINPIKILQPDYLKFDFLFDRVTPYFLMYDGLVSPLYKYFDFLTATLICRVAIWAFQIWALIRLCMTLELAWWSIVLFFVIWLDVSQTLVAGAWIIGSASAKPVSYGFVFLALDCLIRDKLLMAGIFAGAALSFHVLVGGWSFLAMIPALLWSAGKGPRFRRVSSFVVPAVVFGLPGLYPALKDTLIPLWPSASSIGTLGNPKVIAQLSVQMATPFHLDPGYFLTIPKFLKVVLFFVIPFYLGLKFLPRDRFGIVAIFLGTLVAVFLSGLAAWLLDWYWFLQYYPFRVADALMPLFFWMGVAAALQKFVQGRGIRPFYLFLALPLVIGIANVGSLPFRVKSVDELVPRVAEQALFQTEPRLTAYWIRERIFEWVRFSTGARLDDFEEMEIWIRDHTPRDSIFIAPPWKHSFALRAQRAQFVTPLKYIPTNYKILEWVKRMEILNKGPLSSVGRELWIEVPKNYVRLTEREVKAIKERYGAEYLLAPSTLKLALPVVRQNVAWTLYRI